MDLCNWLPLLARMKAEVRISSEDYHKNKKLDILVFLPRYPCPSCPVGSHGSRQRRVAGFVKRGRGAEGGEG